MLENNEKQVSVSRKITKNFKNDNQQNVKGSTWMYRNSIIHTSYDILLIVEELFYYLPLD